MEIELDSVLGKFPGEKIVIISAEGIEERPLIKEAKIISMGAEAIIAKAIFLDIDVVIKWRFPKPYIPEELDKEFRRIRTITEAKALLKAISTGVNVPLPLYVEPEEGFIIMTYIDGYVLRDIVNQIDREKLCNICKIIGIYVAKLHDNSVIHGDVTTSNIMIEKESNDVYIIDFGLANFVKRIEDQAIDVHIFFRSIESVHSDVENIAKKCFIDGYSEIRKSYINKILDTVTYIRKMGRYIAERKMRGVWIIR